MCRSEDSQPFHRDVRREYLRCQQCALVFVPPTYFLSPADEKAHYDLHENHDSDPGYRRFLSRLAEPLQQHLTPGQSGLDFGSGPGPTLSKMLSENGFPVVIYDPFYAPDAGVWTAAYDFITASEVVEHLHDPRFELDRLWSHLRPGGVLGIMTKRVPDQEVFANWHYRNDPTHVVFFSQATFEWLSRYWSAVLRMVGPDVVLFRRQESCR